MAIKTFSDVELALESSARHNSKDLATRIAQELAKFVGSPEKRLKVIHIAGTSGKTSTCYYIRALLEASGQKTGLTVSPHMVSIADRVQIGGKPLDEATFCRYFDEYFKLVQRFNARPSYFEIMMVFALWVFDREKVNYAVVETGLGGLHDSSNICRRADKVCVLTDIGFDHMHVLGSSIEEITQQKVGIVAPGNVLLMYRQRPEIAAVVESVAENIIYVPEQQTNDYRERNYGLSLAVFEYIRNRDGLIVLDDEQIAKCRTVQVPGRLEEFNYHGATVVLDGAHNQQKMMALIDTFRLKYPDKRPLVILAIKRGKEYQGMITQLKPLAGKIVVSQFATFQDTHLGAIEKEILADYARRVNVEVDLADSLEFALEKALSLSDLILVTGSLYAASEVRQKIVLTHS